MDIKCIFFSEFDIILGPILTYQTPPNFITSTTFKVLQFHVIPKNYMCNKLMALSLGELTLLGVPVEIINPKYKRGSFEFNFGLILTQK